VIPGYSSFNAAIDHLVDQLKIHGALVDAGRWQGVPTEGHPDLVTLELMDVAFKVPVSHDLTVLREEIKPNLPWADEHFEERVSRIPSNPGNAYLNWPHWQGQQVQSMAGDIFTHTYQERFWPTKIPALADGIRYPYGDADSVVGLLRQDPYSRQATLPIFFPEDTGAVHGGRIPCTLHYHFMLRNGRLHMWYAIRSCDAVRHFRDDLYMAARLLLWVLSELRYESADDFWGEIEPGWLSFHCYSFHVHKGDLHQLTKSA